MFLFLEVTAVLFESPKEVKYQVKYQFTKVNVAGSETVPDPLCIFFVSFHK
jgi:hypothetical protein